ncbi:mucin-2-like [Carya illinoinensis]|uniref:mucin-2-like n=1 Tax=Carya illinoinensis TaxID=32201 RepID=UPI001C71FAFC|nr:mucin-2-like [Carya illinoinensis]
MDSSSDIPASSRSPRIGELQGPRPSCLRINKESQKITKHSPAQPHSQPRKPVIIYTVSPKTIHVSPENFKTLVQRLTGLPSSSSSSSSSTSNVDQPSNPFNSNNNGTILSAPLDQGKKQQEAGGVDVGGMAVILGVDRGVPMMGSFPRIPSPVPTTLPPIPPNFFSLPSDPTQLSNFFTDLSPVLLGGTNNHMEGSFMPSSSNLVSVPPITYRPSTTPSINYLFNNSLGMEVSTFMPRPSSFVSPPITFPNNSCYSFNNSFGMEGGFMPSPPSFVSPDPMTYPSTTPSIDQYSFNNSFGREGSFMQPSPPDFVSPPTTYPSTSTPSIDQYSFNNSFVMEGSFMQPSFVSPPILTNPSTSPSVSPLILTYPTTPSIDDDDNLLNGVFGN